MATWQHLRSSTANKRPTTSLADGRIAINTNTASPGLFFKDSAGTGIVKVGPVHVGTTAPNSVPAAGGSSGNYLGEQWLDTSVSPAQMKVWNGSTWIGVVADELPVSKLQDGAARQLIQTDAAGTGVEWTSNVDVPGTLDVTSTATFDSIAQYPLGSAGAPTITFTGDNNTGLYSPGADQVAISTGGAGRLFVDASGRLGIGTSSPSYALDVAGTINANATVRTSNGTHIGILGSEAFAAGVVGVGSTSNHPLVLGTNSLERLRITSAGLVGIGTSSPSNTAGFVQQVEIAGTLPCLTLNQNNAGFTTRKYSLAVNAGGDFGVWDNTASAYRMYINSSGSVGIGTTSPNQSLHVNGIIQSDSSGNYLQLQQATNDSYINNTGSGGIIFRQGAGFTERARIDSSGRLLVGTSSARSGFFNGAPISPSLQVEGTGFNGSAIALVDNENGTTGGGVIIGRSRGTTLGSFTILQNNDSIGSVGWHGADGSDFVEAARIEAVIDGTPGANDMPGRLVFSTTADGASSPTERMRITQNGTISSKGATSGDINSNGWDLFASGTAYFTATDGYGVLSIARKGTDGSAIDFYKTGTTVGSVTVSASATAFNTSSDYRLKENVTAVTDSITRLQQLKPSRFNFIAEPGKTVDGFLAHEAAEVVPECVTGGKDAVDDDGNPIYQGIDQSKLVPLLTAALQEAIGEIESLKARVAVLESA